MSEDFGPTFITVTDEDGKEIVLEFVDALEYNGQMYQAFFPAETEGEEEDPDAGLVILKTIHEDGEDLLSTLDSDEELEAVYEQFMELLFRRALTLLRPVRSGHIPISAMTGKEQRDTEITSQLHQLSLMKEWLSTERYGLPTQEEDIPVQYPSDRLFRDLSIPVQ